MDVNTIRRMLKDSDHIFWRDAQWQIDSHGDDWVVLINVYNGQYTGPIDIEELSGADFYKQLYLNPKDYEND